MLQQWFWRNAGSWLWKELIHAPCGQEVSWRFGEENERRSGGRSPIAGEACQAIRWVSEKAHPLAIVAGRKRGRSLRGIKEFYPCELAWIEWGFTKRNRTRIRELGVERVLYCQYWSRLGRAQHGTDQTTGVCRARWWRLPVALCTSQEGYE